MIDGANELLKRQIQAYWDAHPCGTQFTDLEWGSREFFDQVENFRNATQPFMDKIVDFASFKGKRILEIGCGLGTDLLRFARAGAHVTGVDLTHASVQLVQKRFILYGHPAELLAADAEALPFTDSSFDAVYSFGVLHHTPNTQRAIEEARRVLKPGGQLILMLYHRHSLHVFLGVPLMAMLRRLKPKPSETATDEWIRIFDGENNPLGKAYTKGKVREMTQQFRRVRFEVCDPIRRHVPWFLNWINQRLFSQFLGFYLIVRGTK